MTVCRYYLQGNCRFGDRCRFEHVDYPPEYSNRRNDYGYQDQHNRQQYSYDVSYNPQRDDAGSWYNQHQHYTYSQRYNPDQAYSEKQYHKDRNYRYGSNDNVWHGDSEHERYPSAPNYYPNKHEKSRNEWTSGDNRKNLEYKTPRGSFTAYNTSTPKSKVPFSFKDSGPLPQRDSTDLNMNEANMFHAEVMKKDAAEWELSNMWPFSSYSPIAGNRSFPGYFDLSPEELRQVAYEARKNNTFSSYVESVQKAMLDVKRKRDQLKEPSVALMSAIEEYRKGRNLSSDSNVDGGNVFSKFSSNTGWTEMIADEPQAPQRPTASTFSFKTTLETDSVVKASASSFSFKLPSELYSKQTVPDPMSHIYTPLEQLSLQDKEQFSASTFSLGKIPAVPPPKSMC